MFVQDVEPFAPGGGEGPGNLVWQGPKVIYLYLLEFWFVYIYIFIVLLSFCPSVPPPSHCHFGFIQLYSPSIFNIIIYTYSSVEPSVIFNSYDEVLNPIYGSS